MIVGIFVEIVSSVRSSYAIIELLWRCHSCSWLTFLHVLKALPNLLTFRTCAVEHLVCNWVIRHYRFGFVHHFSFRKNRFILLIFSYDSDVLQTLRNRKDIEESPRRQVRVLVLAVSEVESFAIVDHISVGLFSVDSI